MFWPSLFGPLACLFLLCSYFAWPHKILCIAEKLQFLQIKKQKRRFINADSVVLPALSNKTVWHWNILHSTLKQMYMLINNQHLLKTRNIVLITCKTKFADNRIYHSLALIENMLYSFLALFLLWAQFVLWCHKIDLNSYCNMFSVAQHKYVIVSVDFVKLQITPS